MTKLRFVLALPDLDMSQAGHAYDRFTPLLIALEALTAINVWNFEEAIRLGKPLPRLYDAGVIYEAEPPGQEDWLDVRSLYRARKGDCEDLACVLAAERRVYDGIAAVASIRQKFIPASELRAQGYPKKNIPRDGIYLVHVMTEHPDGYIEDPSAELGMKGSFS